ncbi:MAG: GNAT family protein [Bacteroidota bacterium]
MVSIIIDNNILLRTYQQDDAPELFNAVNNSRRHLNPWLDWVGQTTKVEHSLHFIKQSQQQQHSQEALVLGIFYNDHIIGGIGMHHWHQPTRRAQIGYWISHEYEGQGIINKCLCRLIDFLFEKIGLNKIEIHFVPANTRSARVAERIGARVEGILRQSVLRNGVAEDIVIAGLLKGEWKLTGNVPPGLSRGEEM